MEKPDSTLETYLDPQPWLENVYYFELIIIQSNIESNLGCKDIKVNYNTQIYNLFREAAKKLFL